MTTTASSVDKSTTTITMVPEDLNGEIRHNRRNARTRRRIGTATTVRRRRRHRPTMLLLMTTMVIVCSVLFSSSILFCNGWVLSPHPSSRISSSSVRSSSSASPATVTLAASNNDSTQDVNVDVDKAQDTTTEEEEEVDGGISDIDARVLRSLLQDSEKLDLQQEENMKKLLERGVTSKAKVELPNDDDGGNKATREGGGEEEIPYSSQVLQTLADTKLWRKLKRNAEDWVESAQIAITNRIERDAKLVASLGIFAFERALKDVERALPAASSAVPTARKIFQLTDTSSYEEPPPAKVAQEQQDPKELSSADLRKEFATPQDEIRSISKEIQEIFQKADQESANKQKASPFFATRATDNTFFASPKTSGPKTPLVGTGSGANTLKSTARRGAARLDQAYQRQKRTTLAREKENVAQTGSRLASNLVESAYQVQREIQSDEVNEPGYKTKRLRQATASTARQLAAAARQTSANLLSAAQQKKRANSALLASSSTAAEEAVVDATTSGQVEANPVDFVDDQTYFAFKRERDDDNVATTTTEYDVNEDVVEDSGGVDFVNDAKAKFVDVMDAAVVVDVEGDVDIVDGLSSNFVDTASTASTTNIAADEYASIYADMANVGASTGNVDPST
eukprot:CAMPEP_0113484866 /NCGR_PEP_ID=MMETSP0014_2-20120614/24188_1 /TAXON_ID=2857 /ORGANISM="Nitzschia sp." /LENGTH=626 /DNA_ID=CAMNT_0000378493 /DNA_START=23 /DNA_END=1901 /DNA_ORIENTATION=+ /assembly_acc=CAM_ASM_000159